jgi:hypothetical protein
MPPCPPPRRRRRAAVIDDPSKIDQVELRRAIAQFLRNNRRCSCGQPATSVVLPAEREPQLLMNRRTWRAVCAECREKA